MSKGQEGFRWHLLTVGVFVAVSLVWLIFVLSESGTLPTTGEKYEVKAVVPTASLLTPGARVTAAGVEVGSLKAVERADDVGPRALLTLELTDDRRVPDPARHDRRRADAEPGRRELRLASDRRRPDRPRGRRHAQRRAGRAAGQRRRDPLRAARQDARAHAGALPRVRRCAHRPRRRPQPNDPRRQRVRGVQAAEFADVLHNDREDRRPARRPARPRDERRRRPRRGDRHDRRPRPGRPAGDRRSRRGPRRDLPRAAGDARGHPERSTTTVGTVSDDAAPVVENLATATRDLLPAIRDLPPTASAGRRLVAALDSALPGLDQPGDRRQAAAEERRAGAADDQDDVLPAQPGAALHPPVPQRLPSDRLPPRIRLELLRRDRPHGSPDRRS